MTWEVECPRCGTESEGPKIKVERDIDAPLTVKWTPSFDAGVSSVVETRVDKLTFPACKHEVHAVTQ